MVLFWAFLVTQSKESACNVGDLGSIPGWGRSPGEGNGNPLQYSCLENPMGKRAWKAPVHGAEKSRTRLSEQAQRTWCSFFWGGGVMKMFSN